MTHHEVKLLGGPLDRMVVAVDRYKYPELPDALDIRGSRYKRYPNRLCYYYDGE